LALPFDVLRQVRILSFRVIIVLKTFSHSQAERKTEANIEEVDVKINNEQEKDEND